LEIENEGAKFHKATKIKYWRSGELTDMLPEEWIGVKSVRPSILPENSRLESIINASEVVNEEIADAKTETRVIGTVELTDH
jgi:protein tyrosine/serine phosphatase